MFIKRSHGCCFDCGMAVEIPYEAEYQGKRTGSALHVYNEGGEEVLTYTEGVGWHEKETKAESQEHSALKSTYYGKGSVNSGCQYRNSNYYYNKDGVPFFSKEQADRCINGKDWKKIVSVSDRVKSDLEKVVKQDFISSNGAYIPEESKRHDVIKQYLSTIPSEQRNSASWTLSKMAGDYASKMEALVKKNNPGWKPGEAFDTSILDQMDGDRKIQELVIC